MVRAARAAIASGGSTDVHCAVTRRIPIIVPGRGRKTSGQPIGTCGASAAGYKHGADAHGRQTGSTSCAIRRWARQTVGRATARGGVATRHIVIAFGIWPQATDENPMITGTSDGSWRTDVKPAVTRASRCGTPRRSVHERAAVKEPESACVGLFEGCYATVRTRRVAWQQSCTVAAFGEHD